MSGKRLLRLSPFVALVLCVPLFASAGSQTYSAPGTYSFSVPAYGTLTVQVWGAGGGGGIGGYSTYASGYSGGTGGSSSFGSVFAKEGSSSSFVSIIANGGTGGRGYYTNLWGTGGTAAGGTTNTTGGNGTFCSNNCQNYGLGGASPNGGSGGSGAPAQFYGGNGGPGAAPGGGGGGGGHDEDGSGGSGGGGGGYASRTYTPNQLTIGSSIAVTVGDGGVGSPVSPYDSNIYGYAGGNGAVGRVIITWTDPAPTCSVTADTNPLAYGGTTTLHWSSTDAATFYIANIGYVTATTSGSTVVGPLASTAYNGTVTGTNGVIVNCDFTLAVSAPASCTFNGSTVNSGDSVTAYQSSTVPSGNSCVSESRTCTNGTLSGSYAYASCNHDCTFNGSPVAHGASVTAYQSSSIPQGQSCVAQSRTCTDGTLSGSYQYASCGQSCAQSWSCTGPDSQTVTQTNTDCSTTNLTTCQAPTFCSAGSSTCIDPGVSGTISASPRLVSSNSTSKITWSTNNAVSCTVSGNGDSWSGTSSASASCAHAGSACVSSTIASSEKYIITCDGADADTDEDDFSSSVTIYRVPSWLEL